MREALDALACACALILFGLAWYAAEGWLLGLQAY